MLSDSFFDFAYDVAEPDCNVGKCLDVLLWDLNHYSTEDWGYSKSIFPLLRKAALRFVTGKCSAKDLELISRRVDVCYVHLGATEESLIEDLKAFIRVKPTIDLAARNERILAQRTAAKEQLAKVAMA